VGTNYYVDNNCCDSCGRKDKVHIGKASWGWEFSFQSYAGIKSWKAWKKFLKGKIVYDEYDDTFTLEEFIKMEIVQDKDSKDLNHNKECNAGWLDEDGYSFSYQDFS
jgi:hypothetical protein